LAYASEGKTLICITEREIFVYDVATAKLKCKARTNDGFIEQIAVSNDAMFMAGAGGKQETVKIWRLSSMGD
jgi:tricorn protease-like protein